MLAGEDTLTSWQMDGSYKIMLVEHLIIGHIWCLRP